MLTKLPQEYIVADPYYVDCKTRKYAYMHKSIELGRLAENGHIPDDYRVVSTNNKIVIVSSEQALVARISRVSVDTERDDPHDLRYSHRVSWLAGTVAPVVQPHDPHPIVVEDHLISRYPLLQTGPELGIDEADEILDLTESLSDALSAVERDVRLRRLDVPSYVGHRHQQLVTSMPQSEAIDFLGAELDRMNQEYPFSQLVERNKGLVHGDFKADNLVADAQSRLQAIDLDAAAVGPRYFDLAAWRFRCEMGDPAPIENVVELRRKRAGWNEEEYRALIGWKAISSLSFTLRYEQDDMQEGKVQDIIRSGRALGSLQAA